MKIRGVSPSAVYAIGRSLGRIVQLHISDTSTWTIGPSGAEVPVEQRDGATVSRMSFLDVPDVSCSPQRFHSQENLTPHVKPKMVSCPHWLVPTLQYIGAASEMRF